MQSFEHNESLSYLYKCRIFSNDYIAEYSALFYPKVRYFEVINHCQISVFYLSKNITIYIEKYKFEGDEIYVAIISGI